jgi:hypothetical protein
LRGLLLLLVGRKLSSSLLVDRRGRVIVRRVLLAWLGGGQ